MQDSETFSDQSLSDEFIQLLGQYQNQLFGYIFCLVRSLPDAEDVFQQTAMTMWDKFEDFTLGTSFIAWAKTIARNKSLMFLRTQRRERAKFSDEVIDQLADRDLWDPETVDERLSALAKCRQRLSKIDQMLLTQCYGAATTIREVAEQLNRPAESVYSSLSRIRKALYECIRRSVAKEGQI